MAKATKTIQVPTRNMSDTIMDFGDPILSLLDTAQADKRFANVMHIIITVWNAHVLATPAWDRPDELKKVKRLIENNVGKINGVNVWRSLSGRRKSDFADDPRLISKWDLLKPQQPGIRLQVEVQLPPNVKRAG